MSNPQAYITVRKSRLRTEPNNTVYLEKNVEFEIELYNPTSDRIGALITINGKAFPNKFILRPGERAFVERYLDEAKKFLFDTYFVDGSTETKQAIKDNGGLQVQFYRERVPVQPIYTIPPYYNGVLRYHSNPLYDQFTTSSGSTSLGSSNNFNVNSNLSTSNNVSYSANDGHTTMDFFDSTMYSRSLDGSTDNGQEYKSAAAASLAKSRVLRSKKMDFTEQAPIEKAPVETGRVEKGGVSNQSFGSTTIDLEYWAFHTIILKLLPTSQRPEEAVGYCSGCGRRARAKENFCPKCGRQY